MLRLDGDLDCVNDYQRFTELNPHSGIEGSLLHPNRVHPKTGRYGNSALVGIAIVWAPFFPLADALVHGADVSGARIPADGFSSPYIDAVCQHSARKTYGNTSDAILFSTKAHKCVGDRLVQERTEAPTRKEDQYVEDETGRRFKRVPLHASGGGTGETGNLRHGMAPLPGNTSNSPPGAGRHGRAWRAR